MFTVEACRPTAVVTSLRAVRRQSRRVRARAAAPATVCIASGADASCSTPVGWKGDQLRHSSLPLLPNGARYASAAVPCVAIHEACSGS